MVFTQAQGWANENEVLRVIASSENWRAIPGLLWLALNQTHIDDEMSRRVVLHTGTEVTVS